MNPLLLETLNRKAPYQITKADKEGFYDFYTAYGVHYSVGFIEDDNLLSNESYQLIIANVNHQKSPRDVNVRNTVLLILEDFFYQNKATLLYICETGDHKQSMRSRLFEHWFSSYRHKSYFTLMTSSIVDMDGQVNYATIILRNDNPLFTAIVTEFSETVRLLSEKP